MCNVTTAPDNKSRAVLGRCKRKGYITVDNESKKLLEILKTLENETFCSSEFSKHGYSETEARSVLLRLEKEGAIECVKTYTSGNKSYKLS